MKFIWAQIAVYIVLFFLLYNQAPKVLILLVFISTLIIPFALVVKVLTDNPLYLTLKEKPWGQAVISVVTGVYAALAIIWASSEINDIFLVSASNLPWATTILTIVYFFKNIVIAVISGFLVLILLFCNLWFIDVLISNYNGLLNCVKRVVSGMMLVIGLGLALGTSGVIAQYGDFIAKYVAVKADFNSGHRCKGSNFNDVDGVLFLPSGSVLIAIPKINKANIPDWVFQDSPCSM